MEQTVYQKSCCRNSSLCDLLCGSSRRCTVCWIPMLLSSATPCKLWRFEIVWSAKPQLASIYSESLERGIYVERFPESALHGSAVCDTLCCHRGESGFWKSYVRKRIEDYKKFSKWRILHTEIHIEGGNGTWSFHENAFGTQVSRTHLRQWRSNLIYKCSLLLSLLCSQ